MEDSEPLDLAHGLEEDLAEAYEHAPVGYVTTLPSGLIIKMNATFSAMTGHSCDALVRCKKFQQLFNVPGRIYFETHLGPLLAMQNELSEIALDIVRADGTALHTLVNAIQKCNDGGEPLLCRFTIFNATERRRYEQNLLDARRQAETAAQDKTELLAMLSHDIRSPLSSILTATHILERSPQPEQRTEALRIMRSSAESMLELVDQVLEHGRAEAGAAPRRRDSFDLRRLAQELVRNIEPIARSKGITLGCAVDERLPPNVVGDHVLLAQVLGNLVGNAFKFTEQGGVLVELSVLELDSTQVTLRASVVDTGIGIEEDALPRILRPYGQAHEGIARRYGGTGLGLAISRKLLQSQGSDLQLSSRLGEGSKFWFDITLGLPESTTS